MRMWRPWFRCHRCVGVIATAATVLLFCVSGPTALGSSEVRARLDAAAFGARVEPVGGESAQHAVHALEQTLGAKLPLVLEYLDWDDTFPTAYHEWLRDTGHIIVLLVKLKRSDGSRPLWSRLANAQPGSALSQDLRNWATSIRDYGGPVYFVFHKEPNEYPNRENGTASTYRDAWAKVATVFDNIGATNADLVFAMAGSVYGRSGTADAWYPGNQYVDVIASSGVNGSCTATSCSWRSQEQIMAPMVSWSADHPNERLGVIEGATVEDPNRPKRKANWIDAAHNYLGTALLDRMAFYTYWSSSAGGDFRLTTSRESIQAARRWVTDSAWRP
ncbi:MAG: hypothetical protein ABI586_01800 [Candidatus Nanopelagicales bacterium]